jgi:zinc protease
VPVLLRREAGSALAAIDVYFAGGSTGITDAEQGVDQLLLGCLLEGTKKTPRDRMQQELVSLGARPSADANYDYTRLSMVAPREGFPRAVELVGEALKEPLLDPTVFDQQKSGRLAALNAERTRPDSYMPRLVNVPFFAGHPYARRPDGTIETVTALTVEHLKRRLQALLVSGRMLVVVVGDLDREEATQLLEARLGFVPRGEWQRPQLPAFRPSQPVVQEVQPLRTTYVFAKTALPGPADPGFAAAKLTLGILRQRLWETLRTKHALTYAPGAGLGQVRANYGVMVCGSTAEPVRAAELMLAEVRRLQEELVTQEELLGLIAQEETGAYEKNESVASHAQGLGHAQLVAGDWRRHYQLPLDFTQVTPEQVREVARTYLKDWTWAVLGPQNVPTEALLGGRATTPTTR